MSADLTPVLDLLAVDGPATLLASLGDDVTGFVADLQLVLRLVGDLLQFHRFDDARQTLMRNELVRMQTMPGLPQFAVDRLDQLLAE